MTVECKSEGPVSVIHVDRVAKSLIPFLLVAMMFGMAPTRLQAQSGSRDNGAAAAAYLAYQQQQAALRQQEAARREQQLAQQRAQEAARQAEVRAEEERRKGAVVVELFTSQGCSSCPPADVALKQIAEVAKERGLRVYGLSFHVDYWNRLGWNDPYSHEDFSARQATYAAKGDTNRIYTPQMIVNGADEFVGSDKKKAHKSITEALRSRPRATVQLEAGVVNSREIEIGYNIGGVFDGYALNLAIVQTPAANDVPTGENAGRKLMHVNVVRGFKVLVPDQREGQTKVQLPEDFDENLPFQVVGYIQSKTSYAIVGASDLRMQPLANLKTVAGDDTIVPFPPLAESKMPTTTVRTGSSGS